MTKSGYYVANVGLVVRDSVGSYRYLHHSVLVMSDR